MKIICSLATYQGRELSIVETIESLKNQTVQPDEVFVYDNKGLPNLTDNGKFWILSQLKSPVYFFSMDDDLKYPPDYIEKGVKAIKKHPGHIITYHGKRLSGRGLNYYRSHERFRCLEEVKKDVIIDVAGTGVTCFSTEYFNPSIWDEYDQKMADLVFSYDAAQKRVPILCKAHKSGWITHTKIDLLQTIAEQEKYQCHRQSAYADRILELK